MQGEPVHLNVVCWYFSHIELRENKGLLDCALFTLPDSKAVRFLMFL